MNKSKKMYLRMIGQAFAHRFSRVLIASLSLAVGAATLCGLGLLAYSVPKQISQELRSYGANLVVLPQGSESLNDADVATADRTVGEMVARSPYQYSNLLYNQLSVSVLGAPLDDALAVRPYWSIDGELPAAGGADEMLIGENVAQLYRFSIGDRVGLTEPTKADGVAKQVKVTGILRTGGPEDDLVVMQIDTLRAFTGDQVSYNIIEYSITGDQAQLARTAEQVNAAAPTLDAEVVRRISQSESGIAATLQTLIWLVSIIICALTVISVSATLNAIVTERAKEFGLKKALGAQSRQIMGELVGESVVLGLIGGAAGVAAGVWLADFVSQRAFAMQLQINWWALPVTMIVSLLIALAGTLLPARRISLIKPIDVLSGE